MRRGSDTDGIKFHDSLNQIRTGNVPPSMAEVVGYCNKTTREKHEFTQALIECVYRQDRQLRFLREIVQKLEATVMRRNTWMGNAPPTEK